MRSGSPPVRATRALRTSCCSFLSGVGTAAARRLAAHGGGAGGGGGELLVANVARSPAEAAVGIHGQLLGRAPLEHPPDPRRHVLRCVLVEPLHVDHARAELASLTVALPEVNLTELTARELEDELVGARLQEAGKVRLVGAAEARTGETGAATGGGCGARPYPPG